MSKSIALILCFLPALVFSREPEALGLLQIDVVVKVVSVELEELWSVDLTKYTISDRSISIYLKGFDGELTATLTPVLISKNSLLLKTSSIVKSLETNKIIKESSMQLVAEFGEKIIFYPIGNINNAPNVILELNITKHNGVGA